jgi:hypothetical protein
MHAKPTLCTFSFQGRIRRNCRKSYERVGISPSAIPTSQEKNQVNQQSSTARQTRQHQVAEEEEEQGSRDQGWSLLLLSKREDLENAYDAMPPH